MSKLQNIKAIRQMIDGTHRTQTRTNVGFSDADASSERSKKREVGEVWNEYDSDGNVISVWEQKKGYRVRKGVNHKSVEHIREILNSYPNCLDDCRTTNKTKLDIRFRNKFGRCADCQFRIETQMKLEGKWKEYERNQLKANADAFFKNADTEIEIVHDGLSNKKIGYANSDGTMNEWESDKKLADTIKSEYNSYKEIAYSQIENYNKNEELK